MPRLAVRSASALLVPVLAVGLTAAWAASPPGATVPEDAALVHARALLHESPLLDGHNDLPWVIRAQPATPRSVEAYDLRSRTSSETDLERLRQGGVGGQFWSVYVPGEVTDGFARYQLEQLDIGRRMIARYPEALELALRADDFERIRRSGRIASYLGMEGGHVLENSLGALRAYYDLGARYLTLTHNVTLDWADAANDAPRHGGLTRFGREVVREMNRLGMLVDISHVSPEAMADALETSEAPVIFSHSACRALVDHKRNVPDEILRRLRTNGGVVMIPFIEPFVSQQVADWVAPAEAALKSVSDDAEWKRLYEEYRRAHQPQPRATLEQVADHLDHARRVAGADHVGIGADYWGGGESPRGLEDVSRYPYLFAELIRRGWSDEDLRRLANGNVLRAMRRAEEVAARLQRERPPSTATIEELDGKGGG